MVGDVVRDIVYATRMLWKNPSFTAVTVLTLALGIGANTTVFSVVEAIFNFPLPLDDPNRVTFILTENPSRSIDQDGVSPEEYLDWREQSQSFEYLVAGRGRSFNLVGVGEPVRIQAYTVSAGFFPMTGASLALGRPFRPEESQPGGERVTVLSYSFWQQRFGGAPDVLGQKVTLDGEAYTVVGVAAEEFFFPTRNTVLWTPMVLERGKSKRDDRSLVAMGRLRLGATVEEAGAEMQTIARRMEDEHPDTNEGWTTTVMTMRDNLLTGAAFGMIVLYASISFVLLIACANVANLLLARATVREKEIALRTTLGAGRLRVIRQLLTESVVLSSVGGGLGFLLGIWGIRLLRAMLAPDPNIGFLAEEMDLNGTVLAHTLGISVLAALVFGLAPAMQSSRPNLRDTLKEGGRGGSGGLRRRFMRNALVTAEVALALGLLGAVGALLKAFNQIYTADPGFNPKNLLTMQMALPEADYPADEQIVAFYREALERLEKIPGVQSAAITTRLPLSLFPGVRTARLTVEGAPEEDDQRVPTAIDLVVSPSYFEAMEIPIVQGRGLTRQDDEDSLPVAVVNKAMVRRYWAETDPIGRRFKVENRSSDNRWVTVVGVAEDVQTNAHSLRSPSAPVPHVFLPQAQNPRRAVSLALRTAVEPLSIASVARNTIWEIDRNLPLENVQTMEQSIQRVDTQNTFFMKILSGLAFIALALAGVGIYGVTSYSVHQRSHEIGIRMALGAEPHNILFLVIRQGAILTGIGLVIGLVLAIAMVRGLGSQLEGIRFANASSPLTFVTVSLILLAVATLASTIPARRAVRVDPVESLRYE